MGYIGAGVTRFNTADELTVTGDAEFNGNATFGNNDKAIFGAGSDLQIYHDGSNSYVADKGTGNLVLQADASFKLENADATKTSIFAQPAGAVQLKYDNNTKLATTSGGIDVTGTVTADGVDIQGDGTISGGSRLTISDIADVNNDGIRLDDNTTSRYNNLSQDTSGNFVLQHFTGSAWQNNLTVTTSGSVGIGTASPSEELTISKSDDARISITSSGTGKAAMTGLLEFDGSDGRHGYIGPVGGVMRLNTDGGYDIMFQPGGTEKVRIKSTGNVGIGTGSPATILDVAGTASLGTDQTDYIQAVGGGGTARVDAVGGNTNVNLSLSAKGTGSTYFWRGGYGGTASMFIDGSSGNVGIGTTAPTTAVGFTSGTVLEVESSSNNSDQTDNASIQINSENRNALLSLKSNAGWGSFIYFGDGADADVGKIQYNHASNFMSFDTNASEAMRIDSSGNVMIGVTVNQAQGGTSFDTNGYMVSHGATDPFTHISFRTVGSQKGYISTSGSTTSYNTSSDERLKENITDAADAGAIIDAIQVRQFDWIADGTHQDYGMVAQELMTVAPDAVSGDPNSDEMMGVDYSKLVPMLVKEIQQLRSRLAALEAN